MYGLLPPLPADGDHDHAELDRVGRGERQVVFDLAVGRAERHVDHVDGIVGIAVAVRVEREVHALQQRNAVARRRDGAAHLHRQQLGAGRHAFVRAVRALAGNDVGDVCAMTVEVDRVGVRCAAR